MNKISQQILDKTERLPPQIQQEVIDIDKTTGTLQFHQSFVKKIDSTVELTELQEAFPCWEQTDWKDGSSCCKIEMQNQNKYETLHLLLYFLNSKLCSIELFFTGDAIGDNRRQWSKAKELRRKKYHESLFSSVLGKHQWGAVKSVFDKEAGYSYVRLEYSL